MSDSKKDYKKHYRQHIKQNVPLQYAVLPFEGDKIFDFIKKSMRKSLWVIPHKDWVTYQDKVKKNTT